MSLTIVTHYLPTETADYQKLADLTLPNRDEYCKAHGYHHLVHKGPHHDPAWYYGFQRLKLIRDAMDHEGATEFYWMLNMSGLITNMRKRVEARTDNEHDLWMCKDVHGINWGSAVLRNTQWSRDWLDFLCALEPLYRSHSWHDQKAIQDWWLHERWTHKISLLPQRQLQSFRYTLYPPWSDKTPGHWRFGDLCIQFPGVTLEDRIKHVTEMLTDGSILR